MMRRKPSSSQSNGGGYNNPHRRPRHHSGGGHSQGNAHNRPRRNYSAAREKYLAQARDALSSGDRVLAENYLQHAEHCYRMMVEEGYNPRQQTAQANEQQQQQPQGASAASESEPEEILTANANALPSFITSTAFPSMEQEMAKEPVVVPNWEEQ